MIKLLKDENSKIADFQTFKQELDFLRKQDQSQKLKISDLEKKLLNHESIIKELHTVREEN